MTKRWGAYALGNELEKAKEAIISKGLEIKEVKKLNRTDAMFMFGLFVDFEKLEEAGGFYMIIFEATEEEYDDLVASNDMTKVF